MAVVGVVAVIVDCSSESRDFLKDLVVKGLMEGGEDLKNERAC